ncbi:MAG: DUF4041 domain-containing protein [Filomicrobium sp.]
MTGSQLTDNLSILLTIASVLASCFAVLWWNVRSDVKRLRRRFAKVLDIDAEVRRVRLKGVKLEEKVKKIRADYSQKKLVYEKLLQQVAIFDEKVSFAEFGIYEPHFDFGDSERYKDEIKRVREQQKVLVKLKTAVTVHTDWTVQGSKSKGQTMVNRAVKLALRAFNAEADAAIANTRWNNAQAMIRRIENARMQIDKANASLDIDITDQYLGLKLTELRLTHEYREQLKVERDERAQEARKKREEQRLEREAEEARQEEEKYQSMLAKVRAEFGGQTSTEQASKIAELERQLAIAHERSQRAQALAERTKTGFVYVISNIGSFGEGVVKIGLTRRLEPADRVRELGDASVPFLFDTHAMIYSQEAPALESALHAEFADRRVNAANMRKEFFRVSLEEVEEAVRRLAPGADFHRDIEAQEFRETMAKRMQQIALKQEAHEYTFPGEL